MFRKSFLIIVFLILFSSIVSAETIILNSGQKVKGKIISEDNDEIKLEFNGMVVTYYKENIEYIEGRKPVIAPKNSSTNELQSVYIQYMDAIKSRSWDLLKEYVTEDNIKEMQQGDDQEKMMDILQQMAPKDIEFKYEKINGDKGVLYLTGTSLMGEGKAEVKFLKENGLWKVDSEEWKSEGDVSGLLNLASLAQNIKPVKPVAETAEKGDEVDEVEKEENNDGKYEIIDLRYERDPFDNTPQFLLKIKNPGDEPINEIMLDVKINGKEVLGYNISGINILLPHAEEEFDVTYCYQHSYLYNYDESWKNEGLSYKELDFEFTPKKGGETFRKHISAPDMKYRIIKTEKDGITHKEAVFE